MASNPSFPDPRLTAGATVRADWKQSWNISMEVLGGEISPGGIVGIRMDFSARLSGFEVAYQEPVSYFFYQEGTSVCS